jgi:uncharacterized protein with von Willebrand factor type A (vWA) domain
MIDVAPAAYPDLTVPENGRLAENITHFARALRKSGIPVGPERVINAIRAVEAVGFTEKTDFYHTLRACFVSKPAHLPLFEQTFHLFWRDPQFLEKMMRAFSPLLRSDAPPPPKKTADKRAAESLLEDEIPQIEDLGDPEPDEEMVIDAALSYSLDEKLRNMDFEQMSLAEMSAAKAAIAKIKLPIDPIKSRRSAAHLRGEIADWRGTMRGAMRTGGDIQRLAMRKRQTRWPNLVALCDISGSMSGYSRMLLHFLHAASNAKGAGWAKVHSFTFGTRLTNITRHMVARDVDDALKAAGIEAQDWEGGTRIGTSLESFNKTWSRRVLGQGAVVLLITDGLERDDSGLLAKQAERLQLSCRRLIWLNPLLRWDGFAPKASGIRALLPHVDSFRAAHNVNSLVDLADVLSIHDDSGEKSRLMRDLSAAHP